jgi:hypothetical protein
LEVAIKHWKENNLLVHTPSAASKKKLNKALDGIEEISMGKRLLLSSISIPSSLALLSPSILL